MDDQTKARFKELYAEYQAADKELENAKLKVEDCTSARSEVVRQIREEFGPSVTVNGVEHSVVARGGTVFFRVKRKKEGSFEVEV